VAGYSGTPLAKKLGVKPGARLLLVEAPAEMHDWLAPLPEDVEVREGRGGRQDVAVLFATEASVLARRFGQLAKTVYPAGGLWVAWPKQSAKVPTDLDQNVVRRIGLGAGLVDNKVCAISEVWSGLRFVHRLEQRGK
jgi:hypothetical protein